MNGTITRQTRLMHWADDFKDWQQSGLNQKDWCRIHDVKYSTFKYRNRQVHKELEKQKGNPESEMYSETGMKPEAPQFVEIPAAALPTPDPKPLEDVSEKALETPVIIIEFRDLKLTLPASTTSEKLRSVLEVFANV